MLQSLILFQLIKSHCHVFRGTYLYLGEEAIIINALAMTLVAGAIVMAYTLLREGFRYSGHILVSVQSEM